MHSVISPPSPQPPTHAEGASPVQEGWLGRLSPRAFRLVVLLLFTLAAMVASQGMGQLAALRVNYYLAIDRGGAISPLAYGAQLPALNVAINTPGAVRAVVRADSAGEAAAELCALANALKDTRGVVWISTTAAVDPCTGRQLGSRIISMRPAARTELARARWMLLDAEGYVLHSARTVPSAGDVRDLATLLSPAAAPLQ